MPAGLKVTDAPSVPVESVPNAPTTATELDPVKAPLTQKAPVADNEIERPTNLSEEASVSSDAMPIEDDDQSAMEWTTIIEEVIPPLAASEIVTNESINYDSAEGTLPSALFAIPFPAPVNAYRGKNTPPFLMYSPPRAMYQKPPKSDDGKRPKEKIAKKLVRIWQQEVLMGERIKRGEVPNPSRFKRIRGGCVRAASSINRWLPNTCIDTLSRLPPQRKLGTVTIIHPTFLEALHEEGEIMRDRPYQPTTEELQNDIGVLLRKTRQRVLIRAIISGMTLPITLGIEAFVPVFTFEINVAYFAFQIYGLKKAKALLGPKPKNKKRSKQSKKHKQNSSEQATLLVGNAPAEAVDGESSETKPGAIFRFKPVDSPALDPVLILLYNICSSIDPVSFPAASDVNTPGASSDNRPPSDLSTLPPSLKRPGGAVVKDMLESFRVTLPPDVVERYLLDEERVSEDLARYLKKASKEYIDSLSGRGDRKGVIHSLKSWKNNASIKRQQKAEASRQRKQAKKEKKKA